MDAKNVQQGAAQALDAGRLGGQRIGQVFGEKPVHQRKTINSISPASMTVRPMKRI